MAKFICPYCYGTHRIDECGLKCSFNIPGTNLTCKYGVNKSSDGWIEKKSYGKCFRCQSARKRVYCNIVKKEIPSELLRDGSLPIALLGAKASGKSNYIGVLVNEIRKKMTSRFNCSLSINCSEESKRYYDQYYYNPLYKDGELVQGTDQGVIPPLIFPLHFMDKKKKIIKSASLTFYDTAGENTDSDEDMLIYNQYIPNSKGIILLLDPLQVPSIRKKLDGKTKLPQVNTSVEDILNRIIENIRSVKNIKNKINIPLAIVFTKIDVLEKFDILPEDSCLREESEHLNRGVFVNSDFENTNIEMRDILENWLDEEIIQMMGRFEKTAIFGISSLGDIPTDNKISGDVIKPRRVLDPLLWILSENNYIKKAK